MMSPSERVQLRKEFCKSKLPTNDPLAKWEIAAKWLSFFEDTDEWAIVLMDGERCPCVIAGFVLECVWRADWVALDQVDEYDRLLAGFGKIPEPLPQTGSPENYARGAWIFEAQRRSKRRKTLKERRVFRRFQPDEPSNPLDLSVPVGQCTPQQLMEALMRQGGRWNNFDPEPILQDLHQNSHLWLNFMMLPLIGEDEGSGRLYSNLGLALRDLSDRWHADTLYIWSMDDDCVYPLVDFGKTWLADDVQVMDRDRASVFIGYRGSSDPPPVVVYWWD